MTNSQDIVRPDSKLSVKQFALRLRTWIGDHPRRPPTTPTAADPARPTRRRKPAPAVFTDRELDQTRRAAARLCTRRLPLEDLAQEGIVGRLEAARRNRPELGSLSSYAGRYAEGFMRRSIRRARRHFPTLIEGDLPEVTDDGRTPYDLEASCGADDPEDTPRDLRAELAKLMRRLPRRERVIVVLRFGLDGRAPVCRLDIARALGRSEGYVSKVEAWAILKLRRLAQPDEASGREAA